MSVGVVDTDCKFEERHLIIVNRSDGRAPDTFSLTRALDEARLDVHATSLP